MNFHSLRILAVRLVPIALSACIEIEAAVQPTSAAPGIGVDLGGSGRVPQIAGLAGEGEGYGRTEPGVGLTPLAHSAMPGMAHRAGTQMGQPASMRGMRQDSMQGARGDHSTTRGMSHSRQQKMASANDSMAGMKHGSPHLGIQMAHSGHGHAQGTGTINSVDTETHKVNVSHGPISSIGLPAMTMDFAVAPSVDLGDVRPGSRIKFIIEQGQGGSYVIQSITPTGGSK
jgi:Cu(I)/Ag(I) efflux system protein CusF